MGGRRIIKTATVLTAVGYFSLLVYQGTSNISVQDLEPSNHHVSFGPVQVSDLSTEPVTKPNSNDSALKNITLDDIFISVKTSKNYQNSRLPIILKTWFQLAKNQTWFFTDTDNKTQQLLTNGHMINTKCSDSHHPEHLCCKTSVEYEHFLRSEKRWFCHFDDDNYVNIPRLVEVLQRYDSRKDWYLGRSSINEPIRVYMQITPKIALFHSFWFATFGAGVCISRSLAIKMIPIARGNKFVTICQKIKFPDDVTMGFVIERLVKHNLTRVKEFHSHLEPMKFMPTEKFREQISFSYDKGNVLKVPGFDENYDPTRLMSLHCFLFPHFEFCPR